MGKLKDNFNIDSSKWTSICDECGGLMRYYDSGHKFAYICTKCGNVLEV